MSNPVQRSGFPWIRDQRRTGAVPSGGWQALARPDREEPRWPRAFL